MTPNELRDLLTAHLIEDDQPDNGHAIVERMHMARLDDPPRGGALAAALTPSGCGHCGLPEYGHYRRWTTGAGWHNWTAPTQQQIKARMLARRATRGTPDQPNTTPGSGQP